MTDFIIIIIINCNELIVFLFKWRYARDDIRSVQLGHDVQKNPIFRSLTVQVAVHFSFISLLSLCLIANIPSNFTHRGHSSQADKTVKHEILFFNSLSPLPLTSHRFH